MTDDPDDGAKILAKWLGFDWEGISEGSIVDRGFTVWTHGPTHFQGKRDDLRRIAAEIAAASRSES